MLEAGEPAEDWLWREKSLPGGSIGAWVERSGRRATIREVLEGWLGDAALPACSTAAFARIPFGAYSWETPPMTAGDFDRPFECVFVDNPELAATSPDPGPFLQPFAEAPHDAAAATFRNLGGDAWLVAPRPLADPLAYTHLAAFARQAPAAQVHATWRLLAEAALAHIGSETRWLSTAGLGVYWLHFRIDSRPKYYRHRPYKPAIGWSSIDERF